MAPFHTELPSDNVQNNIPLPEYTKDQLLKFTNAHLKNILREKGWPVSGKKEILVDRILNGPSKRKNCEAPISEIMLAYFTVNPTATIHDFLSFLSNNNENNSVKDTLVVTDEMKEKYLCDMQTKTKIWLKSYSEKCKKRSHTFRQKYNIKETDTIKCFVEGKTIRNSQIIELTKTIERKHNKADLFVEITRRLPAVNPQTMMRKLREARMNGEIYKPESEEIIWVGISAKTSKNDQMSNWSIELIIGENDLDRCAQETKDTIKQIRTDLLKVACIKRKTKEDRRKFNEMMYTNNEYKIAVNNWMTDPNNKPYLRRRVAEAAGSKITNFAMVKCDGDEIMDLSETYKTIMGMDLAHFTLVPDLPKTMLHIRNELQHRTHYSCNAAKLWYYVQLENMVKYRIEIRWKGEPWASPQLLLFDVKKNDR